MLLLALNTLGSVCEVGVFEDGEQISCKRLDISRGHEQKLPELVASAMTNTEHTFSDLGRIAVVSGPGSFTGVRAGVAFARGLAVALDIPSVGISSTQAALPSDQGRVLVALPAKKRPPDLTWWMQMFVDGAAQSAPLELDAKELQAIGGDVDLITGMELEVVFGSGGFQQSEPSLSKVGVIANRLPLDDGMTASPIYVRPPDAVPMRKKPEGA